MGQVGVCGRLVLGGTAESRGGRGGHAEHRCRVSVGGQALQGKRVSAEEGFDHKGSSQSLKAGVRMSAASVGCWHFHRHR